MTRPEARFKEVDKYARERAASRGDVYGWAILPVNSGIRDEVLLLVAEKADPSTFPSQIGGHRVRLKPIPEPEPQVVG